MSRASSRGGGLRSPLPLDFLEVEKDAESPNLSKEEQRALLSRNRLLEDNYDSIISHNNKIRLEKEALEAKLQNLNFVL